jgi:PHD-finger.
MWFLFLKYYTAKSIKKNGDWVCCQECNVWYHKTCVGAKGKRQFICG